MKLKEEIKNVQKSNVLDGDIKYKENNFVEEYTDLEKGQRKK